MTGEERSREVAVLARFLHGEHGEEDEFEALDDEEREADPRTGSPTHGGLNLCHKHKRRRPTNR